jgi:ribosomal-protein-alanine N-acetyltransferase
LGALSRVTACIVGVIETKRLRIRPWKDEDLSPFAQMNVDPRVRKFFPSLLSREESDAAVTRFQKHYEKCGFCFLATELRDTSEFIGFIGLQTMSFELPAISQPAVEIGWRLMPKVWNRGLATEGARAILQYAFTQLRLEEVVAITVPTNTPSRRVMEKLGMTYDPKDDFDNPRVADGHPFKCHVLYRIAKET